MYRAALSAVRPLARAPLAKRPVPAAVPRAFATASVRLAGKPAEEQSAQHPGTSGHEHLENPSLSEEVVHADRENQDPLKGKAKKAGQADAPSMGKRVQDAANLVAGRAKETADAVTANVGGPLGGSSNDGSSSPQKRSYHSSAVRRAPENPEGSKPVEEQSAQHPGQSGHDHLENPSMSEEDVHADRTGADPLPGDKKPSRQDQKDQLDFGNFELHRTL
ncbi:hypothetical protein JCM8202_001004 [Rhodotorula sphaerocarpa]